MVGPDLSSRVVGCCAHAGQDRSGPSTARSSLPHQRPESFRHGCHRTPGKPTAREAHGGAAQDAGRSECRLVTSRIRDSSARPEREPTSSRCSDARKLGRTVLARERRKETVKTVCAPSDLSWSAVDWRSVDEQVWRLQVRIAKAAREPHDHARLSQHETAGSDDRPLECLSRMRGNSHVRF